jgi:hypothetical protein
MSHGLLILADALEEDGKEDLAAAFRWLAEKRLRPLRFANKWHWRERGPDLPLEHNLPTMLANALRDGPSVIGCNWNERFSLSESYWQAAEAIVRLGGPLATGDSGPFAPVAVPNYNRLVAATFEAGLHRPTSSINE